MERLNLFFNQLLETTKGFWARLSSAYRAALVAGLLIVVSGIVTLVISNGNNGYSYLFVDLQSDDLRSITEFMKQNSYKDYIIDKKGIKVPVAQVDRLRLLLSQEGLPGKGVVGWEKFDDDDFTRTDFEQEVHRIRAIQGELSRTITAIKGIVNTRVHIVVPKDSLFAREKKKATAAIYIRTKRGFSLEKKQIRGIQNLVSGSVEGLKTENITILDASGNMLTEVESSDGAVQQSSELLKFKTKIEKNLEARIRSIVGKVVGIDRVEAKVDAQVDFTQERQTISDVDPDDSAIVSKNTTGFSMEGQGLNPTGIPGSKSNVPGEQEDISQSQSKAGSKKDTELVNFEFSKKVSEKVLPVGKIMRLTVSAIVDGKQPLAMDGTTPKFEPRTEEEMKQIEELIKNAVGFKTGRDSLTVQNMPFKLDTFQIMAIDQKNEENREFISTIAMSAVVALALVFFILFVVRPYFHWLSYDPERKKVEKEVEEYKPELEVGSVQNISVQEEVPFDKMTPKEQVMYLARKEPKRTTEAIRIMLSPAQSSK